MLQAPGWVKRIAIAAGAVLVVSVLSVGQLRYQQEQGRGVSVDGGPLAHSSASPSDGGARGTVEPQAGRTDERTETDGPSAAPASEGPGVPGPQSQDPSAPGPTPTSSNSPGPRSPSPTEPTGADYPHFGLVTQGVDSERVLVGVSYNASGCGDAGVYEAALTNAALGDPERAIDAFERFVNDTGGIGGLTYDIVVADDGSGGCPEKTQAAAVQLVDEYKVFVAMPGIWDVGDYTIDRKIPTIGGRDDPESLRKAGPNGIGLVAALEPTFDAWASFGKHYLDSPAKVACLAHPDDPNWNRYEEDILLPAVRRYGFDFKEIIRYSGSAATAQQQADAAAQKMRSAGCQHVYYMDVNGLAAVFLTSAATNNLFYPEVWTFTSYTGGLDFELSGRLMDQTQWEKAIGLSARVPPGQHPAEGQCKRIYERYYPNDGQSESAAVLGICTKVLPSMEYMRRGMAMYGELNADTFVLGANAIDNDFYVDAHVPLDIVIESPDGPFRTKPQRHFTVVDWSSARSQYEFPDFPLYWERFGPGKAGGVDLRPYWEDWEPIS